MTFQAYSPYLSPEAIRPRASLEAAAGRLILFDGWYSPVTRPMDSFTFPAVLLMR